MRYPYRNIVITGASSGIGRALANELASEGVWFLLVGRNKKRLEEAAAGLVAKQAIPSIAAIDVSDAEMLAEEILRFDAKHPVDLVVANAGIARGLSTGCPVEPIHQSSTLIDVNLKGAINTVQPLIAPMMARNSGQIALVSSLAAIRPSGDLPAYSASKAGLLAWGVAIRRRLRQHGITVSIVTPGFVVSPMSDNHNGPQPFRINMDDAAKRIAKGLQKKRTRVAFPWQAAGLLGLENLLPAGLGDWIERRFAADIIDPDGD